MTMIDRESAEKLLAVLNTDDDGEMITGAAALSMLGRVLARGLGQPAPPLSTGTHNIDRLERFFDIVIQVEPLPPTPYTTQEIALLARHSERKYAERATEAESLKGGGWEEDVAFYLSIVLDYGAVAQAAESGSIGDTLRLYWNLDTAERDNFGWGGPGWDEGRWQATLSEHSGS